MSKHIELSIEKLNEWKENLTTANPTSSHKIHIVKDEIEMLLAENGFAAEVEHQENIIADLFPTVDPLNPERTYYMGSSDETPDYSYGHIYYFDPNVCVKEEDSIELVDELVGFKTIKMEYKHIKKIPYSDYLEVERLSESGHDTSAEVERILHRKKGFQTEYYLVHEPESKYFGWILTHTPTASYIDVRETKTLVDLSIPSQEIVMNVDELTQITEAEYEEIKAENEEAGDPNTLIENILKKYHNYLDITFEFNRHSYSLYRSLDEVVKSIRNLFKGKVNYTKVQLMNDIKFRNVSYSEMTYIFEKVDQETKF